MTPPQTRPRSTTITTEFQNRVLDYVVVVSCCGMISKINSQDFRESTDSRGNCEHTNYLTTRSVASQALSVWWYALDYNEVQQPGTGHLLIKNYPLIPNLHARQTSRVHQRKYITRRLSRRRRPKPDPLDLDNQPYIPSNHLNHVVQVSVDHSAPISPHLIVGEDLGMGNYWDAVEFEGKLRERRGRDRGQSLAQGREGEGWIVVTTHSYT